MNPNLKKRIATIKDTDINSLLEANIMPLTPLANPDSLSLRKEMLELEKQVLEKNSILFDKTASEEIIKSCDAKNFYFLPIANLSAEATATLFTRLQDKKCSYLAVYQNQLSSLPITVNGVSCFDFIDIQGPNPVRWFLYTSSTMAPVIQAFCLKVYVDNEQLAKAKVNTIQSELKTVKDPIQRQRLEINLKVATDVFNFIRESFENSPLNEKQATSKALSAAEAKTPANPKRQLIGPEPALCKAKTSQQSGGHPWSQRQQPALEFFGRKVYSATEIKHQTIQADMMALSTEFQHMATRLAQTDFTKSEETLRIMEALELLKSRAAHQVEKAKEVIDALTPEKADSMTKVSEANPKRLKPNLIADNPVSAPSPATTTQTREKKHSVSFLLN